VGIRTHRAPGARSRRSHADSRSGSFRCSLSRWRSRCWSSDTGAAARARTRDYMIWEFARTGSRCRRRLHGMMRWRSDRDGGAAVGLADARVAGTTSARLDRTAAWAISAAIQRRDRATMDSTERQVIDELFDKIRRAESRSGPRDPQAEARIREHLAEQPAAPYYMAHHSHPGAGAGRGKCTYRAARASALGTAGGRLPWGPFRHRRNPPGARAAVARRRLGSAYRGVCEPSIRTGGRRLPRRCDANGDGRSGRRAAGERNRQHVHTGPGVGRGRACGGRARARFRRRRI
jgi:Uncharacterized protein conserved in bacteria (DUF2076)